MKLPLAAATALIALAAVCASPAVAAAPEAPTVELKPGSIERGADIAGPHVEGSTVVDGSLRITLDSPHVSLLGTSGKAYVVLVSEKDGSAPKVLRVRRDDGYRVLTRGQDSWDVVLSDDGDHLLSTPSYSAHRTVVRVLDATTGDPVQERTFPGSATVLSADGGRAVLGSWGPDRTFWWDFVADDTRRISNRPGYAADIDADRVASYTGDPYDGGCSLVTDLGPSPQKLSRSCDERVTAFSPDGLRMATIHILSDGLGPNAVNVRRTHHGALLARYTAEWFGAITWETSSILLLDTNGRAKAATIRCEVASCERASDLKPVPRY
ncbi:MULTISPECIES: hypothetical protein [unclassified Nocardioides]|uniref:hypothetical protein n=1 Tax=unclassified Nocardioides TaxID=2615069 RepID=UPI0009F092CC|nr:MULTISPECIES: hypothetical protein [unclassified Nocardioides]GAW49138.1 Serine/arginine repetitive matrix protein 2 [Nocardioides sp. PD653-B2]GAW56703.1 Serine/arginine repetitive matrix protein 2 [Nocardioides sp. PD653]